MESSERKSAEHKGINFACDTQVVQVCVHGNYSYGMTHDGKVSMYIHINQLS